MNILAIDTSSNACSVALLYNNEVKVVHELSPMQQAQKILPLIDELLKAAQITLNQLDALAFGCGPGSFTGLRIAISVVQGLGYAINKPLISISSLAALAQAAYIDLGWKNLLVGVDARIQEVYWGAYQINTNGLAELVGKECVCRPEEVPLPLGNNWYGVGDAWKIYREQIAVTPLEIDATRLPMAMGVLMLAKEKFANKNWTSAAEAFPVYLRNDVAKKSTSQ